MAIFAGVMAGIGDSFLNEWAKSGHTIDSLIAGVVYWNIALIFFVFMLKNGLFADSVVFFVVSNFLVSMVISQVLFHEQFTHLKGFGVVLALCSLVAMSLG
jgi:multidrug transporter EmrE-like cation transporter